MAAIHQITAATRRELVSNRTLCVIPPIAETKTGGLDGNRSWDTSFHEMASPGGCTARRRWTLASIQGDSNHPATHFAAQADVIAFAPVYNGPVSESALEVTR